MKCETCGRDIRAYSTDHATIKLALRAIKKLPVSTTNAVADELGMAWTSTRQVLKWMHKAGLIRIFSYVKTSGGGRPMNAWCLADGKPDAPMPVGTSSSAKRRRRAEARKQAAEEVRWGMAGSTSDTRLPVVWERTKVIK